MKHSGVPGIEVTLYRMLFASLFLYIPIVLKKQKLYPTTKKRVVVVAALFFTANMVLWNTAIIQGSAYKATLFVNAFPLWVALLSIVFLKFMPTVRLGIGAGLMILGGYLLLGEGENNSDTALGLPDVYSLGAGLSYALFLLVSKYLRGFYNAFTMSAYTMALGTGVVYLLISMQSVPLFNLSLYSLGILLLLGLCHAVTVVSVNSLLALKDPFTIATFLLIAPIITTFLSVLYFNEPFHSIYIGAILCYLVGIYVVNKKS